MHPALKKWSFRFLKVSAMLAGGFVVLAFLLTTFYSAEIKQIIVGELNKSLKSPVQVQDIELSLLRHFPYAAIELKQVNALDAPATGKKEPLLQAERISLLFNMSGLFSRDVAVKKVVMKNGWLHVRIDKEGNDNYHIWKTSTDTAESVIDLQKIMLSDVGITYQDLYSSQDYSFNVHDATLKGLFASKEFTLDVNSAMMVDH